MATNQLVVTAGLYVAAFVAVTYFARATLSIAKTESAARSDVT